MASKPKKSKTRTFVPPGWFDPPVAIITAPGRTQIVRHVVRAAEVLKDDWPADKRGAAWRRACQACLDVSEGRAAPDDVVKPLTAAAKAADVLGKVP